MVSGRQEVPLQTQPRHLHRLRLSRRLALTLSLLLGVAGGCQSSPPADDPVAFEHSPAEPQDPIAEESDAAEVTVPATEDATEDAIETMSVEEAAADEASDPDSADAQGDVLPEAEAVAAEEGTPEPEVAPEPEPTPRLVEPEVDDPEMGATLTVLGIPRSARVRIVNIKPKYRSGIRLRPGTYEVVVDAPGYEAKARTIKLGIKDIRIEVKLSKP